MDSGSFGFGIVGVCLGASLVTWVGVLFLLDFLTNSSRVEPGGLLEMVRLSSRVEQVDLLGLLRLPVFLLPGAMMGT